jgi:CRISPR-associated protein Cas1
MDDQFLSVASLHALIYCERLFYLEEVERIRVADAAVFAGRRLHEEIALAEDEAGVERETFAERGPRHPRGGRRPAAARTGR